ncbi:MAG: hypothetical protein EA377_08245 [Phycisphaerales bacterium]|nr:MAG: hypothetical protein EA377_08245 [Phycisphaerales bacterium]
MEITGVSDGKTIRIMCPNLSCQRILAVPGDARGKLVRCRNCHTTVRIPMQKAPVIAPAAKDEDASSEAA